MTAIVIALCVTVCVLALVSWGIVWVMLGPGKRIADVSKPLRIELMGVEERIASVDSDVTSLSARGHWKNADEYSRRADELREKARDIREEISELERETEDEL